MPATWIQILKFAQDLAYEELDVKACGCLGKPAAAQEQPPCPAVRATTSIINDPQLNPSSKRAVQSPDAFSLDLPSSTCAVWPAPSCHLQLTHPPQRCAHILTMAWLDVLAA
jgi:hypothetical protein